MENLFRSDFDPNWAKISAGQAHPWRSLSPASGAWVLNRISQVTKVKAFRSPGYQHLLEGH
jgi:hypothetical protein